jgi:ankyrin repeat protein
MMTGLTKNRGNVQEVIEAIAHRQDLNAYVYDSLNDSYVLLHLSTFNGHLDAMKLLLEDIDDSGILLADVNCGSRALGWTALYIAARNNKVGAVEVLLAYGANVNQKTSEGYTALLIAAQKEHKKMIPLLLEGGAVGDTQAFMGLTAFDVVAELYESTHEIIGMMRGYESHFAGNILDREGPSCKCAVSWPGVYAKR